MITVYEIHLERPIGQQQSDESRELHHLPPRKRTYSEPHAQHYIGGTENLERRLAEHRSGEGAALLRQANEQGIPWQVVRTWECEDGWEYEKRLKDQKNAARLCPVCNPTGWQGRGVRAQNNC